MPLSDGISVAIAVIVLHIVLNNNHNLQMPGIRVSVQYSSDVSMLVMHSTISMDCHTHCFSRQRKMEGRSLSTAIGSCYVLVYKSGLVIERSGKHTL